MSRRQLTKEFCQSIAKDCVNRFAFQKKDCAAYKKAFREGWIDEWFPVFHQPIRKWTKEALLEEALKYTSRNAFKWGNWNAYYAARRRSYFDELCSHMETISTSDKNVLYLLQLEDKPIYKIGITSNRCKHRRRAELKYKSKLTFNVIRWVDLENADELERDLLKLGTKISLPKFPGHTEIRVLTPLELKTVIGLIDQAGGV